MKRLILLMSLLGAAAFAQLRETATPPAPVLESVTVSEITSIPTPPASEPPAAPEGYVFAEDTNGVTRIWKVAGEVTVTNRVQVHVLSGRLIDVKVMHQQTLDKEPEYTGEHMLFIMPTDKVSGFYSAQLEIMK